MSIFKMHSELKEPDSTTLQPSWFPMGDVTMATSREKKHLPPNPLWAKQACRHTKRHKSSVGCLPFEQGPEPFRVVSVCIAELG